jgi:hypothetical protein
MISSQTIWAIISGLPKSSCGIGLSFLRHMSRAPPKGRSPLGATRGPNRRPKPAAGIR